jgi:hypothetical protein
LQYLQVAIQTVEQLRLTLDSRRRTVASLEGDITNMQTKTTNPQDPKLMKFVERKHRQEVKMLRANPLLIKTLHCGLQGGCLIARMMFAVRNTCCMTAQLLCCALVACVASTAMR